MVFNSNGLFSRANDTAKRYNKAKARETLEILLSDAQIQKYAEGLTEEQLDKKIQEIGELLDKEDPNPNIQDVVVEGHIFKIDKSVPKIIDYVKPADGIIITATLKWINGETQSITVSGTIKTYSGGNIKEVTATKSDGTSILGLPQNGGEYKIENIRENTEITITAKDSKGKTSTKKVTVLFDNTKPVITEATAVANGMKIKIRAVATDDISGISGINYTVEPTTVNNASGATASTGTIASGQELELTASEIKEYTVKFIAVDKAGNESESAEAKATTDDTIPPTLSNPKATATGLKIKIGVIAEDNYSGVKQINYTVSPATVNKPTGTLTSGNEIEILASEARTYTISFTATDNKNNTSTPVTATATTTMPEILSVEEAKSIITPDNYPNFIGTKVSYGASGTWRVFYVEDSSNYFGDGVGSIYLRRELNGDQYGFGKTSYGATTTKFGKMNKKFGGTVKNMSCQASAWLLDSSQDGWKSLLNSKAKYVIGSPSLEMWIKAYNKYIKKWEPTKKNLDYGVDSNGYYLLVGRYGFYPMDRQ